MRIILIGISFLLAKSSLADDRTQYNECKKICRDYENSGFKSNCQGALPVSPKPKVHKACRKGETMGYDHACLPTCMGRPHEGRDYEPGNSHKACEKFRNNKNILMWCRQGYDTSFARVKKDIEIIMATTVKDAEPEKEAPESSFQMYENHVVPGNGDESTLADSIPVEAPPVHVQEEKPEEASKSDDVEVKVEEKANQDAENAARATVEVKKEAKIQYSVEERDIHDLTQSLPLDSDEKSIAKSEEGAKEDENPQESETSDSNEFLSIAEPQVLEDHTDFPRDSVGMQGKEEQHKDDEIYALMGKKSGIAQEF